MAAEPRKNQASNWDGFLPKNAIIMVKRGSSPASQKAASSPSIAEAPRPQTVETPVAEAPARCAACEAEGLGWSANGNLRSQLAFVGQGPMQKEDQQLLERMIEAMGLKPFQVCLAQIEEGASVSETCVHQQLETLRPKVIVALGASAARTLLGAQVNAPALRGKFQKHQGMVVMPTFHPSELIQGPELKRPAWADLQQVAKELGIVIPAKK